MTISKRYIVACILSTILIYLILKLTSPPDMIKNNIEPDFLNQLTFEPLTKMNWNKFVRLFGEKGACGNR